MTPDLRGRIIALLARLQSVLGTNFEFEVKAGDAAAMNGAFICTSRTTRGQEDPLAFLVEFDAKGIESRTDERLAGDLFHEWLHAMIFDFADLGAYRLRTTEREELVKAEERAVYELERRLWPFVKERVFRKGLVARLVEWVKG